MPSFVTHTSAYRLADHVHACRFDEQVVLLDTRRDKYLGIAGAQLAALCQCVVGWPDATPERASPVTRAGFDTFLKPLLDQRMLAPADTTSQPVLVLEEPQQSLDAAHDTQNSPSNWRDLLTMAWCAPVTAIWLKRRCLADIATGISRLRPNDSSHEKQANPNRMREAVVAYMRLRPFLFTAHDQCLHDSLTLVRFLATRRLFPSWVIGVRTRPFAAHSWVQYGPIVLNDVHEHARDYKPILVV